MDELTVRLANLPQDLPQIHKIRYLVFQIEQGVDPTLEFDGRDNESEHMLVYQGEKAVGTVRLRWLDASTAKIERFAVLREFRGRGIGQALMESVLAWLTEKQITTVCMNAQQPVQAFYERFGFAPEGQVFEEAGIPHIRMKKLLR
ncbi:MAG: GNAT family N-acetyltransferase [Oscillatoriales cyanobacterium C42_A2020_001]|nr:GNAT family N-acetyltransferase [Leptolyngbyaceae cyanobacterium C42_A2020_001]